MGDILEQSVRARQALGDWGAVRAGWSRGPGPAGQQSAVNARRRSGQRAPEAPSRHGPTRRLPGRWVPHGCSKSRCFRSRKTQRMTRPCTSTNSERACRSLSAEETAASSSRRPTCPRPRNAQAAEPPPSGSCWHLALPGRSWALGSPEPGVTALSDAPPTLWAGGPSVRRLAPQRAFVRRAAWAGSYFCSS